MSSVLRASLLVLLVAAGACGVPGARFPSDVQTAIARHDMRRMETDQLLVYYPEGRRELAERLATRVERCAVELKQKARIDNRHSREKMVLVVPDVPFNNAYVLPPVAGLEDVAVIPTGNTLDFTTTFGLPPDPGYVGCHEIVHYVQMKQIAGLWGALRTALGELATPQIGFDAWFLEGLATYYEAQMQPGAGRPAWPVFTSMFHAAYAGGTVGGSDLSELKRQTPLGHHYLVGSMFVQFLAETYGEPALWRVVEIQAHATSIILSVNSRFGEVYGKGIGDLMGEFQRWSAARFPVRARPAGERVVRTFGDDARWAWGPSGEVAAIDEDIDEPARLRVWSADGRMVESIKLVDLIPPRRQVAAAPLLVSGMSFARDGSLWFTSIDLGGTYQTTRLYRWRSGDGLKTVAKGLGPGGAVSPDGARYYHMMVDGDRWSLAVWEAGKSKVLWNAPPGQFALRAQPSRDGAKLAVSIWDGSKFAVWVMDAASGAKLDEHASAAGIPVYDPSWTDDGRLLLLDVVDRRFQVAVVGDGGARTIVTDAPYGVLEARASGGKLRFLARDGWRYTLDEVDLPAPPPPPSPESLSTDPSPSTLSPSPSPISPYPSSSPSPSPSSALPAAPNTLRVLSDRAYSRFDSLFRPTLHTFALFAPVEGTTHLGLALSGGDRLDLVRWALAGYINPKNTDQHSGAGGVILNDAAPWVITALGQRLEFTEEIRDDMGMIVDRLDREVRDASLVIGRQWRGTYSLAVSGVYAYDRVNDSTLRLYGPDATLGYTAIEGTRATGIRRGIVLVASGAYYPRPNITIRQARGELDLWAPLPLPFARRHILSARARGHGIYGAPEPVLTIGGESALPQVWSSTEDTPDLGLGDSILPAQRRFAESLRGFEDFPLSAERVVLGDVGWRYPLMIDRGTPNLAFLPATFIRELELELFAAGCYIRPGLAADSRHIAGGAAVTLHFALFRIPLALQYQISKRITDDEGMLQLVGFGPDI
jgi:hypothetical protein